MPYSTTSPSIYCILLMKPTPAVIAHNSREIRIILLGTLCSHKSVKKRIVIAVRIRYIRSNCILPNEGMPKESHSLIRAVSLRIMTAASRSEVILFRLFSIEKSARQYRTAPMYSNGSMRAITAILIYDTQSPHFFL